MQQLADAAIDLCTSLGAYVPPDHMISRLSKIAAGGAAPSNAERDLHVLLARISQFHVELEEVDVRMWDHKECKILHTKIPIIMPDKLAAAIWNMGSEVFEYFFLGGMSRDAVRSYWDHVHSTSEWFQVHPASSYPRSGLIPLSLYADDVATYKGTEVASIMVIGWTSDFCFNRSPLMRYLLLTAYSEFIASDYTYRDIMTAVCARITDMVDITKQFPWSSQFTFMFSSNQGDLKYMLYKHNLFGYNSNEFCSWCKCQKAHQDPSMTLGDFREVASHRNTLISHEEYMQSTTPEESNSSQMVSGTPFSVSTKLYVHH